MISCNKSATSVLNFFSAMFHLACKKIATVFENGKLEKKGMLTNPSVCYHRGMNFSRPDNARYINRLKVLSALRKNDGMGRVDLSRKLGINKVSISEIVDSLIKDRLVKEKGKVFRSQGRPTIGLGLDEECGIIIVFSFQKENVIGVSGDIRGRILRMEMFSSDGDIEEKMASSVSRMASGKRVFGIYISKDGDMDFHSRYPVVIRRRIFSQARSEKELIGNGELGRTLFLELSDEVSGLLTRDGNELVLPNIGHMRIKRGRFCKMGHEGCLEAYFSTYALKGKAQELSLTVSEKELMKEKHLLAFLYENLRVLSSASLTLSEVLDVNHIVLTGDISSMPDKFIEEINGMLDENGAEVRVRKCDPTGKGELGGAVDSALDWFFFQTRIIDALSPLSVLSMGTEDKEGKKKDQEE